MTCYTCQYIIADAAYGSNTLREMIDAQGAVAVTKPPPEPRGRSTCMTQEMYLRRDVIERFVQSVEAINRRVATRYDKYADRYLGFVYFADLRITAKKCKH